MAQYNQLTPGQAEMLACLAEECAEVIQVVGKILRHGYESTYPECGTTNRNMLECELGDVAAIVNIIRNQDDIVTSHIDEACTAKLIRIQSYLHHNHVCLKRKSKTTRSKGSKQRAAKSAK